MIHGNSTSAGSSGSSDGDNIVSGDVVNEYEELIDSVSLDLVKPLDVANFENFWSFDDNVYISDGTYSLFFNKETSSLEYKEWFDLLSFDGSDVWSIGDDYYVNGNKFVSRRLGVNG